MASESKLQQANPVSVFMKALTIVLRQMKKIPTASLCQHISSTEIFLLKITVTDFSFMICFSCLYFCCQRRAEIQYEYEAAFHSLFCCFNFSFYLLIYLLSHFIVFIVSIIIAPCDRHVHGHIAILFKLTGVCSEDYTHAHWIGGHTGVHTEPMRTSFDDENYVMWTLMSSRTQKVFISA